MDQGKGRTEIKVTWQDRKQGYMAGLREDRNQGYMAGQESRLHGRTGIKVTWQGMDQG